MDYRQLDGTSTTAATDSPMTDQKQAPERIPHCTGCGEYPGDGVADTIYALTKQRDELAAEITGLKAELDIGKSFHDLAVKERDLERIRVDRLTAERDQALAASAAREIAMRDRAVEESTEGWRDGYNPTPHIYALPLSPEGQQALDDVRAEAWAEGYDQALKDDFGSKGYTQNPYRTQPSRSSDAGK